MMAEMKQGGLFRDPHLSLSRKRSETSSPANGSAMRGKKVMTKAH